MGVSGFVLGVTTRGRAENEAKEVEQRWGVCCTSSRGSHISMNLFACVEMVKGMCSCELALAGCTARNSLSSVWSIVIYLGDHGT